MLLFLVDEDLPRSTARALRDAGYAAADVRDIGLRGSPDAAVFERAQRLSAVLLTGDSDFANILHYPPGTHSGIVVSRIPDELSTEALNRELLAAFRQMSEEDVRGSLVIVEPGRLRIRR